MLFQILDWNYFNENEGDDEPSTYKIRLFGRTSDNKTVYVKVNNFYPYFYVEIDKYMSTNKINIFIDNIKKNVYPQTAVDGFFRYEIEKKHNLYGFTDNEEFTFLKLPRLAFLPTVFRPHSYCGYSMKFQ